MPDFTLFLTWYKILQSANLSVCAASNLHKILPTVIIFSHVLTPLLHMPPEIFAN